MRPVRQTVCPGRARTCFRSGTPLRQVTALGEELCEGFWRLHHDKVTDMKRAGRTHRSRDRSAHWHWRSRAAWDGTAAARMRPTKSAAKQVVMIHPKRVMRRSSCAEARLGAARGCKGAALRPRQAGCEHAASDQDRRPLRRCRSARRHRSPAAPARPSASQRRAGGFRRQGAHRERSRTLRPA